MVENIRINIFGDFDLININNFALIYYKKRRNLFG